MFTNVMTVSCFREVRFRRTKICVSGKFENKDGDDIISLSFGRLCLKLLWQCVNNFFKRKIFRKFRHVFFAPEFPRLNQLPLKHISTPTSKKTSRDLSS